MNLRNNTSAMTETAIMSAIVAMFAIAGAFLPILGYVLFLIPVAFAYLGIRHTYKYTVLSIIISGLLVFIFGLPQMGIFIFLYGGITSTLLKYLKEKKIQPDISVLILSIGILTSTTILLAIVASLLDLNILGMIRETLNQSRDLLTTDTQLLNGEFTEEVDGIIDQVMLLVPFLLILSSVMAAGGNYIAMNYVLKRTDAETQDIGKFSSYRLPDNIIIGTTLILVLTYLSGRFGLVNFDSLFINVFLIIVYIFMIQGVAVLFYFLEQKSVPNIFKGIILVILFLFQGIIILGVVGWLDMLFNFRKIKKK